MNFRLLPALIVLLVAFSLCAACTGSDEPTGPSQTQTPGVTATPASTISVSLTPGPTQAAPPGKEVVFGIEPGYPSRYTHDLTITFNGGKGQEFVTGIDLRVTKSTGEVIAQKMQPIKGDNVILKNAQGENRVEITVAFVTGGSYKVTDEIVTVP